MVRRSDNIKKGSSTFSYENSPTAATSSSATAESKYFQDQDHSEYPRLNFEEIATMATSIAMAKAEQIVAERLAAANQAQIKTAKMLADATNMLNTIKSGLDTSSKMQSQLESDVANIKGNAIAALSIFVSFFAFITVSINVFSKAGSAVSAAALVFIFWALLVGFNIMIGWQFNTLRYSGIAWFALILVSSTSMIAIGVMYYVSPEMLAVAKPILEGK